MDTIGWVVGVIVLWAILHTVADLKIAKRVEKLEEKVK